MIVVDASVVVAALLGPGASRVALEDDELAAPHLLDTEVLHAARRLSLAGVIDDTDVARFLASWSSLAITRYEAAPLVWRIWALRHSVTAYDATYVALAEMLDCALVTGDQRLAAASGPSCPIVVLVD